jgi:hypothetical protein
MTAASDPDILAGVERWARVRDLWMGDGGCEIVTWRVGGSLAGCRIFEYSQRNSRSVSPALALTWALLVETDAGPVDVGRCPACEGKRLEHEREVYSGENAQQLAIAQQAGFERMGYTAARLWTGEDWVATGSRLCSTCSGTGREAIPAARLLLDAAPRKFGTSALAVYGDRPVINGIEQGDAVARERLLVHADHLQAIGDPRGELLALALGPWSGEPADCGECQACAGMDLRLPDGGGVWTCATCRQHPGRQFGQPGTAPALRWLEWLTWAREFAAEREARRAAETWAAGVGMPPVLMGIG